MEVIIQSPEIYVADNLKNKIVRKLQSVCKVYERVGSCNVLLRKEKSNEQQHHIIEVKVTVPGETLFTRQKASTFEAVLTKTALALKHQLQKHKEKFEKV